MPAYQIYRMKDAPRQNFRWAPHVSGAATVKRKDYEPDTRIDASNEYAAWDQMRASERALAVGDLLETDTGELRICKYIGFEAAAWWLPPAESGEPVAAGPSPVAAGPPAVPPPSGYSNPPAGE